MSMRSAVCGLVILSMALSNAVAAGAAGIADAQVNQTAREIPVAYDVDVVVVGGSTGAVASAVAAAEQGAKVFLAAPRPYLGDDMTATLRLWLEEGETPEAPLAKRLFADEGVNPDLPHPNRLGFTYRADQPFDFLHRDFEPPERLCDGMWHDPAQQSVQYNDDVNLVFDLGQPKEVESFRLMCFDGGGGGKGAFRVGSVTVSTSDDGKAWTKRTTVKATSKQIAGGGATAEADLNLTTRYVRLFVRKHPHASRMLLGEVELIGPISAEDQKILAARPHPRPMHIKQTLDDALLDAGVDFLYTCYVTDVLRDADGRPCGVVMTNRAGRQAVLAKTIIDVTDRARVARLAGAEFRPFSGGQQTLRRVVIGGEVVEAPQMTARTIFPPFRGPHPNPAGTSSNMFKVIEYTLKLPVERDRPADWAAVDQQARTLTYHPEQQITADAFFQVPPDAMRGQASAGGQVSAGGSWQGIDQLPPGAFRPRDIQRLYVLGGCADVSRPQAEKLLRPLALIDLGTRLGRAAAEEAKSLAKPAGAHLPGKVVAKPAVEGDVKELLYGVRPGQTLPKVTQEAGGLPVLARYDVVVVGGGTAGAPAGIAAARQGAKTLVVEYLCGLGGVSTTGYISKYCHGNRVGFTAEVDGGASWVIEQRMEWFRSNLLKAGGDIWFNSMGCGAVVEGHQLRGVVVATPEGRGVVLADVVIDATGNADIAAAAGAECRYTDASEFAMQGTGLPPRYLGAAYTNTDYTFVDETDLVDVWRAYIQAKPRYAAAFDLGQLVDTRERRSIVGDATLTVCDLMAKRTYPDTIVQALTGYDTHGYIVAPYLLLKHPLRERFWTNLSYRCLLPQGFEGLLVSGIGVSTQRDAQPLIRMQPDVQNQGYAAGVAAAMAVKGDVPLREIDIRALQRHLVEVGCLPKSVLTEEDSFPVSREQVAEAVESVRDESQGLAIILSHADMALPLLRKAHGKAQGEAKLLYAKILGMLGDDAGLETLLDQLRQADRWDAIPHWQTGKEVEGWRLVGWSVSNLDNTIMAIGRVGDPRAVPVLVEKVEKLSRGTSASHYRALSQALANLRDPRAAEALAKVLARDDVRGYAQLGLDRMAGGEKRSTKVGQYRSYAVRELLLARALYLCGDHDGLGEAVLREYAQDLRGHFARHAQAVLEEGKP